ncbi:hypothetical protein ACQP00_45010 [Dactylosporangium sp. CS-047395]|uniref:hypothetical protein n=1 Tax=Dactylosporangium sp. CS-047395 TaxID=3239936 RepID=UPI003D8AE254
MAAERSTSSRAHVEDDEDELAERARQIVDRAPPLTEEQRARLAALLRPLRQKRAIEGDPASS